MTSSPLVVGGTDIATIRGAIDLNRSSITDPTHTARADRFWASNNAFGSDDIQEVLEVNYASAGITNTISFDAVKFPHVIAIEYSTSTTDEWQPILDAVTRRPVKVEIQGSYPPILGDPSTITGHFHPQHDYEGHWTRYDLSILPSRIQKIRFILQRTAGNGPVDVGGNEVAYSLALQNIDTGYRVAQEEDIPFHLDEEESDTSGQVFANSADLFGSNLGFSKKTHRAANLALNTDVYAPLIWKSEPQPVPHAVVNFYADLRDAAGEAQMIDRIFIDPLYLGCSVNLYYSNDAVTGDFLSSRRGLTQSQAVFGGAKITSSGPLDLGTWHSVDDQGNPAHFDPYYVQFDNLYLGFDPSVDWWIGIEWTRNWSLNTDGLDHDLFACDAFRIGQNQNDFYLSTTNGDVASVENFTVDGEPIQILAAYVGGRLILTVQQGTESIDNYDDEGVFIDSTEIPFVRTQDVSVSVAPSAVIPSQFVLGTTLARDAYAGGSITSFILSQSSLANQDFIDDPGAYSLVPLLPGGENKSKYNALLRFDTSQLTLTNSTGFVGGPAHPYDAMNWTPIPRNYEMQRGHMKLPPTKAKFWNLEITNLRPENVEKFVPVTRTVKYFPPELFPATNLTSATTRKTTDDLGLQVLQDLAARAGYRDTPQYTGTGDALSGVTNTEVYVAPDSATAERLATAGTAWTYQQFHADTSAPRFSRMGPHVYVTEQSTQTSHVSYFAGLRNIVFEKTVRSAPQNLPIFEESFLDGEAVASSNWIDTDNGLYSGAGAGVTYAVATSVVHPTQTGLRGLQFAVQQSDAQVIDIGGNFSDSNYDATSVETWSSYGDGRSLGLAYNQTIDRYALLVSRDSNHGRWDDIAINWGFTYGDLEAIPATYGLLSQGTKSSGGSNGGGVRSQAISAPVGGKLHAAVRATASENLHAPLYIQILDADSGSVLAEAESNVSKNETKQWYASVDLDDFGASVGQTWGDLSNHQSRQSFSDAFTRANASALGSMDSGQPWVTSGTNNSLSIVSNKAVGAASNSRSEIDTGTPWGTLSLRFSAVATTATHASAIPLVDLGGIYLLNDATFQDQNLVASWGTLGEVVSTAHDYNFKFMLTTEVPVGQRPAGIDTTLQPYSLLITTGTLGSDTWLKTISSSRLFTSVRALMGTTTTSWSKFAWVPTPEQARVAGFIPKQFIPSLVGGDNNGFTATQDGKTYTYQGQYTYDTNTYAIRASSLPSSGSVVNPPAGVAAAASGSGGSFTAGTYYYKVTAINAYGETTAATEVNATVVPGGLVTVTWSASAGATNYKIYRGTSSGNNFLLGLSGNTTSYTDLGDDASTTTAPPAYNTTNGAGTMMITDVVDQYGSFRVNVAQMPSNMTASDVPLLYLDYAPAQGQVLTLRGNGSIVNEITGTTVGTIAGFNPLSGPITVHYVNTALVSSTFKMAHPIANPTAILIFQNGTTYLGMYTAPTTWYSTVRGIAGANNGTGSTQYTIIEGFNWNPDGSSLATDASSITWGQVDYQSTRTYGQMSMTTTGSTKNLALRIVQKGASSDSWFVQSATFFWDPVVWEFSCDSGRTWWEASDIRNDPNGVLLFPIGLKAYNKLKWRVSSYAGRVSISHLAIRPWYVAQHGYAEPQPAYLPQGPNLIPSDFYAPIDRDPRWMAWDRPVPHWWWDETLTMK